MKAQSHGEHAGTEAYMVVDPVAGNAVLLQPWNMRANPSTGVRNRVETPGHRIWIVLIDGGCPINGHATQDEAQKDWNVQPMAPPYQQVVPANYKHAGFTLRRACSHMCLTELCGMWHKYSPRYFPEVIPLGGAGAKCARPSSISH